MARESFPHLWVMYLMENHSCIIGCVDLSPLSKQLYLWDACDVRRLDTKGSLETSPLTG